MLEVAGGRLHYEVSGSGVPIVLIHGFTLDTRMWDDQIRALADIATVIRYDLRGFGQSVRDDHTVYTHADDLWRLVDHLDLGRVALAGLSMGGRIAIEATLAAAHRVTSLVLLDAVLDGIAWDDESERGMAAIGDGLRTGGLPAAKAAWLRHGFFTPAQRQPDSATRLEQMVADYSGQAWIGHDPYASHPGTQRMLSTLSVPTTVVVGELDVPCFHQMADVLAANIPGARKIVVADAGHMVNMEDPTTVNQILREAVLATCHRSG
jgi:3-oxoadipate enol-lactonase